MALKPGNAKDIPNKISPSMTYEMETAFAAEIGKDGFSDRHLRMIFAAVSQGVVTHLKKNPDAFKVKVQLPDGLGTANGKVTNIE